MCQACGRARHHHLHRPNGQGALFKGVSLVHDFDDVDSWRKLWPGQKTPTWNRVWKEWRNRKDGLK